MYKWEIGFLFLLKDLKSLSVKVFTNETESNGMQSKFGWLFWAADSHVLKNMVIKYKQ